MTLPVPKPTPQTVTINTVKYSLIAFYYPNQNTPWDDIYNAPFLGNFWPSDLTITLGTNTTAKHQQPTLFHTSEAAFQATKWWDADDFNGKSIREQFSACKDGNAAFRLRNHIMGNPKKGYSPHGPPPDYSYAGLQREPAMRLVLDAKFADPTLRAGLLATGNAYLLEHNNTVNRDRDWSDNRNGHGKNMLGKALMDLRALLPAGAGEPTPHQQVIEFTYVMNGDAGRPARTSLST